MISAVEKVIFAVLATILLLLAAVSMPKIEAALAIAGILAMAYLVLEKAPVKQKAKKMIERIRNN